MEFQDLIKARRSLRGYKPDPVPDELLNTVLEAARWAPTAANLQPFQLIVIHTKGREAELGRIYNREWFVQAPIVICAVMLPSVAWTREDNQNYGQVDIAIVMDHLTLAAADVGLGTCWVGAFNASAAREVLNLPDDAVPVLFTPLGFPDDAGRPKVRKPLDQLVRYERW